MLVAIPVLRWLLMFDDWWWLWFLPLAVLFWLVAGRPGWRREKRAPATEQMSTRADETVTLAAAQTTLPLETLPPSAAADAASAEDALAADEAALRAAYRAMEEDNERRAAERRAAEDAARLETERQAAEQAAREEARRATEEAARRAAETARLEAERRAAEEATRLEAERRAAEQAARLEAERRAAEEAARLEAERRAAEQAAQLEAERRAAEDAARQEAEREAAEQAARLEAERQAAANAARLEAERRAAEEAARAEAQRRAAEDAARAEAERQRAAAAAAVRLPEDTLVMVADDSKVVRVKTSRLLAAQRYRVALAEDGQEALRQIAAAVPDVLITDVEMPGMDGFELTRHVRESAATRHVPIIMITSADDRLQQAAAEAGVTVLLGKPYPEEVLLAHIARLARVEAAAPAAAS